MKIRIGSRASHLALAQTQIVIDALKSIDNSLDCEIVKISTRGDRWVDRPLSEIGGKGLFVKEIERALLDGEIDIAVHSMKDMPAELADGLCIAAVLKREDPRDALIYNNASADKEILANSTMEHGGANNQLKGLRPGARIGTSSLRRTAQLKNLDSSFEVVPLRGNVDTRLKKMKEQGLDAIILAAAGLKRLGMDNIISQYISVDIMVPAVGQGAIAVEMRDGDPLYDTIRLLNHRETEICVRAERAFMNELGGNCRVPIGAYAEVIDGDISLLGMYQLDGKLKKGKIAGKIDEPEILGIKLAKQIVSGTSI